MIMGTLTAFCQISYMTALSVGPMSLTGLVYNLAMLVPIFVSKIRYDEPLSAFSRFSSDLPHSFLRK